MIITSDFFKTLQIHNEIWRLYELAGLDWDRDEKFPTILKPISLLSTLATSHHRNTLNKIIIKQNLNSSFSGTIEWPSYRIMDTTMRPSLGSWFKHYQNDAERNRFGKNLLIFHTQSDRRIGTRQNSLHDYRYRLMNPLIHLDIDVNVHDSDLYQWWPNEHSSLPLILGELIANGMMNFHSTTNLSTPLVLLRVALA